MTLGVELWVNQGTSAAATGTIAIEHAAGGIATGMWHVPPVVGILAWQLIITGSQDTAANPADDVRFVEVQYQPRGMYR